MSIIILLAAYSLDLILGDPKYLPMIVVYIGRAIERLKSILREKIESERKAGLLLVVIIVGCTYIIIFFIVEIAFRINRNLGFGISIYLLYNAISIKSMALYAKKIAQILEKSKQSINKEFWIKRARVNLSQIVGRDTHNLDKEGIIRATMESVAESITDGIISPLFYMFLGGLPLCWAYKAINTLDSMIGYVNEEYRDFGYFAAKLDDIANFIPARITALLMVMACFILRKDFRRCVKIILRDGGNHESPNSGLPEAAIAGALGIRLGGLNYYQGRAIFRPFIGEEVEKIKIKHIKEVIIFLYLTSFLMVALFLIGKVVI